MVMAAGASWSRRVFAEELLCAVRTYEAAVLYLFFARAPVSGQPRVLYSSAHSHIMAPLAKVVLVLSAVASSALAASPVQMVKRIPIPTITETTTTVTTVVATTTITQTDVQTETATTTVGPTATTYPAYGVTYKATSKSADILRFTASYEQSCKAVSLRLRRVRSQTADTTSAGLHPGGLHSQDQLCQGQWGRQAHRRLHLRQPGQAFEAGVHLQGQRQTCQEHQREAGREDYRDIFVCGASLLAIFQPEQALTRARHLLR